MRDFVFKSLGLLSGDLADDDVYGYLNRVYQREIPLRIHGASKDGFIEFPLVDGVAEYSIDAATNGERVIAVKKPVFVYIAGSTQKQLAFYDDPIPFWEKYSFATGSSIPSAVLATERLLVFRDTPNAAAAAYTCRAYASMFRAELPEEGLAEELEAWTCIEGATQFLASDIGDTDIEADFKARYGDSLAQLAHKYHSRARGGNVVGDVW